MRKRFAASLSAALISAGVATGAALLTAAPAQATWSDCNQDLEAFEIGTPVTDTICLSTEVAGSLTAPVHGDLPCQEALEVQAGVPERLAAQACADAVR
ncbi:hypothetical protein [Saccharopolyspora rosea]|uniref:hypothetical protein n=1 Tax=Saccharopolyspora rosea TaxID=524884 RepID=UPI0021D9449E|nr:hypothetical protein [Saccharopolyspora rosea]